MDHDLEGMVVLVTGAGKGSGRRIAEAFAGHGATVAANDLTPINLDETVKHIQSAGGRVKAYVADMAKKLPVQGLLNQVLDDLGTIDVLVCCAEVEPEKTILEMDDWDWQRVMDVNLTGVFYLVQSVGRIMKEKGAGVIILASDRAHAPDRRAAYFASKAGLDSLARSAAAEFSGFGVRVFRIRRAEQALEAVNG